jgi:superfamily II DNA/RNA helicase
VHRAGRTARAGRIGHCLTMLKHGQLNTFKQMKTDIASSGKNLQKFKLSKVIHEIQLNQIGYMNNKEIILTG